MMRLFLLLFLILVPSLVVADNNQLDTPKALSYELDVGFFPEAKIDYAGLIEVLEGERPSWNKEDSIKNYPHMKGKAVVEVDLGTRTRESLHFYLHGELRVHWVKLKSENLQFNQEVVCYPRSYARVATKITVELKRLQGRHRFVISYGGVFSPSIAQSPSSYMRIDGDGAYLRGLGYSMWFPILLASNDDSHPVDFNRVAIETKKKFVGVFTGQRISEKVSKNKRISLWKAKQIGFWEAQMTVRPFDIKQDNGIFLYHLDHPDSMKVARDILKFVEQLRSHYSNHFKIATTTQQLHVAELPNFASGISSGNMIGMTSGDWRGFSLLDKDTSLEELVAHELVHAYVIPEVSTKSPLAALFMEGFPSYFHLHILAEILGEEWYQEYMLWVEKWYLKKKQTGKSSRGRPLPPEKPILSIGYDEIGDYKDTFILNDRVRLFLNYLRGKLGKEKFRRFTRQLCQSRNLTPQMFSHLIEKYLPASTEDLRIWLQTNDFPKRFQLRAKQIP